MPRLHKIVTRHSQHASGPVSLIWWRRVHAQTAGRTGRTAHQSPIQLRCEQRAAYVSPGPLMPPGFLLQIAFLKLYLKTSKNTVLPAVLRKPWAASLDASVSLFPVGLRKGNRATYPRQITVRGLQWFASSESAKEISNSNLKMCPWLFFVVSVSEVRQNRTHGFTFRPALNNKLGPRKSRFTISKAKFTVRIHGPKSIANGQLQHPQAWYDLWV